jgi:hypothetical protein
LSQESKGRLSTRQSDTQREELAASIGLGDGERFAGDEIARKIVLEGVVGVHGGLRPQQEAVGEMSQQDEKKEAIDPRPLSSNPTLRVPVVSISETQAPNDSATDTTAQESEYSRKKTLKTDIQDVRSHPT